MYVKKRNGAVEPLDITKIQKQTNLACDGLENVSASELEVSAKLAFNDGMKTSDIQKTLISTAVDLIDIDRPDWSYVAGRLLAYDIYSKCDRYASSFYDYIVKATNDKLLSPMLLGEYTKEEIDYLESVIDENKDKLLNYLSVRTFLDKYLKRIDGEVVERPQYRFMVVSMFIALAEKDNDDKMEWVVKFYNMISNLEAMAATPTINNGGTLRSQLSSCYVLDIPDNIEGIFDAQKDFAILSKYGAGVGANISHIRAMGGDIDGHAHAAGGVVPPIKVFNDISIYIDQMGNRPGAIATYLDITHGDILDFLDLRKNSGKTLPSHMVTYVEVA